VACCLSFLLTPTPWSILEDQGISYADPTPRAHVAPKLGDWGKKHQKTPIIVP
jgi:hypothetical protein